MKSMLKTIVLLAIAGGLALLIPQSSCGQNTGFYIKADAGGNVTLDTDLKEFFGENTTGVKMKFDPGVRLGVDGGYDFCDFFAAEVELGVMANEIKSIDGATRIHDATFANVPFLINGKFQFPNRSPLTPYLGAGAGFSEAIIDAGRIEFGNTFFHGSDSDTVFAWQAFAGLRWRLNDNMGLGLEYRYFAAESPSWRADSWFGGSGFSDTLKLGRMQTHSLSVAFHFKF